MHRFLECGANTIEISTDGFVDDLRRTCAAVIAVSELLHIRQLRLLLTFLHDPKQGETVPLTLRLIVLANFPINKRGENLMKGKPVRVYTHLGDALPYWQ